MVKTHTIPEGHEAPEERPKTRDSDDLLREINEKLDVLLKRTDPRKVRKTRGSES